MNKKSKCSDDSHSSADLKKIMLYLLNKCTLTQSILCLSFLINVRTTQYLIHDGQEINNKKSKNKDW